MRRARPPRKKVSPRAQAPEVWLGGPRDIKSPERPGAVALCYPNTYWVAMSSLGFQIIYESCWSRPGWACERFFAPSRGEPWSHPMESLESRTPLRDFGVVAFSVSFEGDYVNLVQMLASGGVPPLRSDRDGDDAIVLAGGPAVTMNPLPLSDFVDAFVIGEGDEAIHEILDVLSLDRSAPRRGRIDSLSAVEGVWVPGSSEWSPGIRRVVGDLDATHLALSSSVLAERTEFRNMVMTEVMRGCKRSCAFCLARQITAPFRVRGAESVVGSVMRRVETAERQGLSRAKISVGLVGPAVSDHPDAAAICAELVAHGLRVSTSSLRLESLSARLASALREGGQRSITLAPEAGTERLRSTIGKPASDDEVFRSLATAADAGFRSLKLYFMFGLPTETDDDIDGIADLCRRAQATFGFGRLRVSAAPFVPKPQTPFADMAMLPASELKGRASKLEEGLTAVDAVSAGFEGIRSAQVEYRLAHSGPEAGAALRRAALDSEPITKSLMAIRARG